MHLNIVMDTQETYFAIATMHAQFYSQTPLAKGPRIFCEADNVILNNGRSISLFELHGSGQPVEITIERADYNKNGVVCRGIGGYYQHDDMRAPHLLGQVKDIDIPLLHLLDQGVEV
jgi:hypothetical protein